MQDELSKEEERALDRFSTYYILTLESVIIGVLKEKSDD